MKKIKILSLEDAISFNPPENTLMIRLLGSDKSLDDFEEEFPLKYQDYFTDVLSYQFDDITPITGVIFGGRLFNKAHARQIIGDFIDNSSYLDCLAVHCRAGISRSSAIACSLNHIFKLGVKEEEYLDQKIHCPNMHVYNTMVATARELGIEFDFCKSGDVYFS